MFRPLGPVDLSEHTRTSVLLEEGHDRLGEEAETYRLVSQRFELGDPKGSEYHDGYQP